MPVLSLAQNTLLTRTSTVDRSGWIRTSAVRQLAEHLISRFQVSTQPLWIALHLPLLSLEAFCATLPQARRERPVALVADHQIAAANAAAAANATDAAALGVAASNAATAATTAANQAALTDAVALTMAADAAAVHADAEVVRADRLGDAARIDCSSASAILVWYPDFHTVVWLDPSLTELARLGQAFDRS